MTDESTAERRSAVSHWKRVGLFAGGLAVGYALVQERERVAGAVANVQDTLTTNGLTLMQKLSEMSDAFLAKVHETVVAAAPPKYSSSLSGCLSSLTPSPPCRGSRA